MVRFSANLGFLWKELPLPEAIGRAATAGFGAVECHQPFAWPAADVAAALRANGLGIVTLNASFGGEGELGLMAVPGREAEARRYAEQAIDYAAAIGCRFVSVFAGVTGGGAAAESVFRSNLEFAAARASAAGVAIVLEPLSTAPPGYHVTRVADAAATLAAVGAPNLAIMADTFHVMAIEGSLSVINEHLPAIGHIQISGWPDRAEPDNRPEQLIDFDSWIPTVVAAGYRGSFGAEYNPVGTVEAGLGWFSRWQERNT